MEHKSIDQMARMNEPVVELTSRRPMTREERLERWATLLEENPERRLATLPNTEYQLEAPREAMRCAGSPISIAFGDPILRGEGLKNDTYGEAKKFFGLSDWQLHEIVCYCHYGATMSADAAARRVRAALQRPNEPTFFGWAR